MPTKKPRIALALPEDLQALVERDAAANESYAATIVTRIVRQHYRKRAEDTIRNLGVLKGSGLLTGQQEVSLDFSGGSYAKPAQSDEPSTGAAQA